MPSVLVGTDGSAINNPHGPAGWAWVIDAKSWNAGSFPKASNQFAEMFALYRALIEIPLEYDIHVQTDSRFVVNMLGQDGKTGWAKSWKRNKWRKADGKVPANLTLVQKLDEAVQARKGRVRLEWVKGHSTNKLNQAADKMCTLASAHEKDGKKFKGPGWVQPALSRREQIDMEVELRRREDKNASTRRKPSTVGVEDGFRAPVKATNFCGSCGGPINALGECKCSY